MKKDEKKKTSQEMIQEYIDANGTFPKKKNYLPWRIGSCILSGSIFPEVCFRLGCRETEYNTVLEAMKLLIKEKIESESEEEK